MIVSSLSRGVENVRFPAWGGERAYMVPFTKAGGLPENLARWQSVVDQMLFGIEPSGPVHLMVDQGHVVPGASHRRGGIHIDGNWNPELFAHGHRQPFHGDYAPELIILCSDVEASRAYIGKAAGRPKMGGDCSHIDISAAEALPMRANTVYIGNETMLHESLPLPRGGQRSLVRLNVPLH